MDYLLITYELPVSYPYLTIQPRGLNYKYAVGLFNSKLFFYWLFNMGKRKGKQLQIDQAQIVDLPVCVPDENDIERISSIVDTIIEKNKCDEDISHEVNLIDEFVYDLYGLTENEKEKVNIFVDSLKG